MAEGNSKSKRRDHHSGRSRGSTIKTGNAGSRKQPLTTLEKWLFSRTYPARQAAIAERNQRR